ncbi:S8 family serine peptidase [Hymenobacter sediminicola]|uniref:S8 family serine peptidase n=1 Tax=Hymenobacter sediminicola TaxID=2761579 RepID=A0A7G7WCB1_9BACT|nr:S8 family serine peptidase [Hymenobacter sediminicola]QNH64004.1 S8 family serine peptidase [Hymenobacter sediminicola]
MRLSYSALLGVLAVAAALASPVAAQAQTNSVRKHLVYFRDKAGTPFTVGQPQAFLSARAVQRRTRQSIAVQPRDLPVTPAYVSQLRAVPGATVWYTSRWFNAAVVSCDSATLRNLQALPFVRSATTLNRTANVTPSTPRPRSSEDAEEPQLQRTQANPVYGIAYNQALMLGAVDMHNAGFRGEGMNIAVFDDGFPGVDQTSPFASMRNENRLADVYNFVERNTAVYGRDSHGTHCLSTMAANETGKFIGTAPKATYRLYLTENIIGENPIEEVNWLLAAERADSAGVDVISSSLGYSSFDTPYGNYAYSDLNGRTAISTRAASIAARVGMVVVNSAGNEGNNSWQHILAPADADSILAVAAVDSFRTRVGFSSIGPSADGRIKPNLASQGHQTAIVNVAGVPTRGSGTSYACPVLAGMVACFWQANPTLTAQQVISFLQRSGSQFASPDNLLGYGIPNFVTAYNLANPNAPLSAADPKVAAGQLFIYPNPVRNNELYLQLTEAFHGKPLRFRFYDARGALVAEQTLAATGTNEVRLTPGPLAKGVYTCDVSAGEKVRRTVRFVKL